MQKTSSFLRLPLAKIKVGQLFFQEQLFLSSVIAQNRDDNQIYHQKVNGKQLDALFLQEAVSFPLQCLPVHSQTQRLSVTKGFALSPFVDVAPYHRKHICSVCSGFTSSPASVTLLCPLHLKITSLLGPIRINSTQSRRHSIS